MRFGASSAETPCSAGAGRRDCEGLNRTTRRAQAVVEQGENPLGTRYADDLVPVLRVPAETGDERHLGCRLRRRVGRADARMTQYFWGVGSQFQGTAIWPDVPRSVEYRELVGEVRRAVPDEGGHQCGLSGAAPPGKDEGVPVDGNDAGMHEHQPIGVLRHPKFDVLPDESAETVMLSTGRQDACIAECA